MSSRRSDLSTIQLNIGGPDAIIIRKERNPHAGLWLDKYLEDAKNRTELVREVSVLPETEAYSRFYNERWKKLLSDHKATEHIARVKGRMIIGLGDESVLETSVTLHRTYGIPYIPGSALKGLAASYIHHYFANDANWQKNGEAYRVIFGDTDTSGYITFFDALYIPDTGQRNTGQRKQALYSDTITIHHPDYYQNDKSPAVPADWDSPTPIPFLSATGSYLIALAAPGIQSPSQWIQTTFTILEEALKIMGIGAKTSSGYGRMEFETPPIDPEIQKVEGFKIEIAAMPINGVASQINAYYQKWQQLTNDEARRTLAQAIIEKVRQAGREKASADKGWYKELLARVQKEDH